MLNPLYPSLDIRLKRTFNRFFLLPVLGCALLLLPGAYSHAQNTAGETRYVTDVASLALRSGASNKHRIVLFLKSNRKVTLLETDEESGFSRVSTSRGTEGWIRTEHLVSEVPARQQLEQALQKINKLMTDNTPLRQQIEELETERNDVRSQVDELSAEVVQLNQELSDLKKISSNAVMLNRNNKELNKENQLLKNKGDLLQADNDRLKAGTEQDAFFNGALAVGFGVLLTLLIPRLVPRKKRNSEWA